jgi:hypothetical protein
MGILEFIFGIIVVTAVVFTVVGAVAMIYDTKKLEEENEKLKADLKKARERKLKREYKKVEVKK